MSFTIREMFGKFRQMHYLVKLIAIIFFIISFIFVKIALFLNAADGESRLIVWVMGIVSSIVGAFLYKKGKQIAQRKGQKELEKDSRNPIIYLRSFSHDKVAAKSENDPLFAKFLSLGFPKNLYSEEEQLASAVKHFGPFIAIGDPKDILPQLGASRIYANNTEWKDLVIHLIEVSQLAILYVGDTPNFWWEVKMVLSKMEPQKIIFLLPDDLMKYNKFKAKFELEFSIILANDYTPMSIRGQSFSAILAFSEEWKSHIIYCKEHSNWIFKNGPASDFREIFQKILNPMDVQSLSNLALSRSRVQRTNSAKIQMISGIISLGLIIAALLSGFLEGCAGAKEIKVFSYPMLIAWFICSVILYMLVQYGKKSP